MTVQVVQHTAGEFLGLIEDHLEGRGVRFRYCRPFAGKVPLPGPDALDDGLILLGGGPWGSAGTRDLPTLREEIALTRAALAQDRSILAIGLGAQILALAAGGRSEPAPLRCEILTARRTRDDALNGYLPESYPLVTFMRDWPAAPPEASILATDERDRPVLWQLGSRAFAFAGHPGLKIGMLEDLVMEFDEAPPELPAGLEQVRALQRELEDALVPIMTGLSQLTGWIKLPR